MIQLIDFGYFSYFHDHINVLIFGIIDDDTVAVMKTIYANYPIFLGIFLFSLFAYFLFKISKFLFVLGFREKERVKFFNNPVFTVFVVISILLLNCFYVFYKLPLIYFILTTSDIAVKIKNRFLSVTKEKLCRVIMPKNYAF